MCTFVYLHTNWQWYSTFILIFKVHSYFNLFCTVVRKSLKVSIIDGIIRSVSYCKVRKPFEQIYSDYWALYISWKFVHFWKKLFFLPIFCWFFESCWFFCQFFVSLFLVFINPSLKSAFCQSLAGFQNMSIQKF